MRNVSPDLSNGSQKKIDSSGSTGRLDVLMQTIEILQNVLSIRNRTYRLSKCVRCFVGSEFVDTCVDEVPFLFIYPPSPNTCAHSKINARLSHCPLQFSLSTERARALASEMLSLGLLQPVLDDDEDTDGFIDGAQLYRFTLDAEAERQLAIAPFVRLKRDLAALEDAVQQGNHELTGTLLKKMDEELTTTIALHPADQLLVSLDLDHEVPHYRYPVVEMDPGCFESFEFNGVDLSSSASLRFSRGILEVHTDGEWLEDFPLSSINVEVSEKNGAWLFSRNNNSPAFQLTPVNAEKTRGQFVDISRKHKVRLLYDFARHLFDDEGSLALMLASSEEDGVFASLLRVFGSVGLHVGLIEVTMRKEMKKAIDGTFLLKEKSICAMLMCKLLKMTGQNFLESTILQLSGLETLSADELTQNLFNKMLKNASKIPAPVRRVFRIMSDLIDVQFPGDSFEVMRVLFFLQFACPALLEHAERDVENRSKLKQVAATLRKLAIGKSLQDVVQSNQLLLLEFYKTLCQHPPGDPSRTRSAKNVILRDLSELYSELLSARSSLARLSTVRQNASVVEYVKQVDPLPTFHSTLISRGSKQGTLRSSYRHRRANSKNKEEGRSSTVLRKSPRRATINAGVSPLAQLRSPRRATATACLARRNSNESRKVKAIVPKLLQSPEMHRKVSRGSLGKSSDSVRDILTRSAPALPKRGNKVTGTPSRQPLIPTLGLNSGASDDSSVEFVDLVGSLDSKYVDADSGDGSEEESTMDSIEFFSSSGSPDLSAASDLDSEDESSLIACKKSPRI